MMIPIHMAHHLTVNQFSKWILKSAKHFSGKRYITSKKKKRRCKKAQQSPWISSIWKLTGFNISHSKKELSNLEKRVQQTQRHKNCVFADY